MFQGCLKPLLAGPPEPEEGEAYYQRQREFARLVEQLGYEGGDAEDDMWETWRRYGAVGPEAETGQQQARRYAASHRDSLELNPGLSRHEFRDPDVLVTCGMDYQIRTWDPVSLKALQVFEGHTGFVNVVEPYHGSWLLSCSDDGSLRCWKLGDQKTGRPGKTIWCSWLPIKSLCVLPGCRAACGSLDGFLRILSIHTGEVLHKISEHVDHGPDDNHMLEQGCGNVWCVLHLRQNLLLSSADDATLRIWDIDTMRCLGIHVAHQGYGTDVDSQHKFAQKFAPVWRLLHLGGSGGRIASSSYDRTIVIWDVLDIENVQPLLTLSGHDNSVTNLALLEENIIISCCTDSTFKTWDLQTGVNIRTVDTRGHPTCAARLDDHRVAIGGGDSTIRVYDWKEGKDLMGEDGFYAHDFCLSWMSRVYTADVTESWLAPIMYRSTDPIHMMLEQNLAPQYQKMRVMQARQTAKYGRWD